tara:strand:+ start:5984 stop:7225 length:1242 start_codon:yes stop_codon:yes gene_type:complete
MGKTVSTSPLKRAIYSGRRLRFLPHLQFFSKAFQGILYNQIWEDPEIDLAALNVDKNSKILAISSGGCNGLNYLTQSPESVTLVDIQQDHLNIAKIRAAAVKLAPTYQDLFNFMAVGKGEENIEFYNKFIAPNLSDDEQKYWQSPMQQLWKKYKKRIDIFEKGFYPASKASLVGRKVFPLLGINQKNVEEFLKFNDVKKQSEYFDQVLLPKILKRWRHFLFKIPSLCAFLGVHPNQIKILQNETNQTLKELFIQRVRQTLTDTPCYRNYFAWQILLARYNLDSQDALPMYLQERYFQDTQSQLIAEKLNHEHGSIVKKVTDAKPGDYNRFVLLDAQEWMSNQDITTLWENIIRVGGTGARIIFRTGTLKSYLQDQIPPELYGKLCYHKELSENLFKKDRLKVYGGFHCYEVKS